MASGSEIMRTSGIQVQYIEAEVERVGPIKVNGEFVCIRQRSHGVDFNFPYLEENVIAEGTSYRRLLLVRCPTTKAAPHKLAIDEGQNPQIPQC